MKGVLYMVVKKKEFYCNLGVQTGYAEIKPVLKAVRMPDGTVSSFCQFTLAIPGERTSYTIFYVEELAQQCAESVTPGDYAIAYGRTTCKRDSSGVCLEAVSVLDGGSEMDIEQAADDELTGPLHITLRGSGFHNMRE